jgi:hypothetical protein
LIPKGGPGRASPFTLSNDFGRGEAARHTPGMRESCKFGSRDNRETVEAAGKRGSTAVALCGASVNIRL